MGAAWDQEAHQQGDDGQLGDTERENARTVGGIHPQGGRDALLEREGLDVAANALGNSDGRQGASDDASCLSIWGRQNPQSGHHAHLG